VNDDVMWALHRDIQNPHIEEAEHFNEQFWAEYMVMHGALREILQTSFPKLFR